MSLDIGLSAPSALILLASAFGAGVMNAMAGGGTILTFPTLVFLGQPTIAANATSTVALLPGTAATIFGFRREVQENRGWLWTLLAPSLVGGAIGSVLLLATPEEVFARLAPVLVLFATVLFMLQGVLAKPTGAASHPPVGRRLAAAVLLQFGVAVYGGYFGAGIGILMLALLGFMGLHDIHAANGVKAFFGLAINAVAAAYFILRGAVVWPLALVIVLGATLGGYSGARFARHIGRGKARAAVVLIGLLVTALLFWQQAG